jgi:hypothetical protein
MAYHKAVSELMSFSSNSYYVWKKEERPIISFLHKYLSEDDIQEFLETGSVSKFDNIEYFKFDFHKNYFHFLIDLEREHLVVFFKLLNENQNDLTNFSLKFIDLVINYDCSNSIKAKLIENYSKIEDKNKLSYYSLKSMLKDKFQSFYTFSLEYSRPDRRYGIAIKHLDAYLKVFLSNKKFKTFIEMFPELSSQEFVFSTDTLKDYGYLDYDKKYYEYLLSLI